MTKKEKKTQARNKGERERLRLKKEMEEADLSSLENEDLDPLDGPELTDLEKEYMGNGPVYVEKPGAKSFEELDSLREAQETASGVRSITYDVQDLVSNILRDSDMAPAEKANSIKSVAEKFAERTNAILKTDLHKDMDVLEIEAILGSYGRSVTFLEKAQNFVEDQFIKGRENSKALKDLSDSDFALPEKRKYPIQDKAHARNALARAAQLIQKGGEEAEEAKEALPNIRAATKNFGIETAMEKSSLLIQKDKAGDWRWVGKPSNNFIDLQNDIMSKSAHEKYAEWFEKNTDIAPVFLNWHIPGTARENPVDFVMEHDGALIMSGKLTEPEAATLLKMQSKMDLGMSLQGYGLRLDPTDQRVITDYYLFEVSDLPLEKAANPFTSLETIAKEVGMNKLEYLTDVMGSKEKAQAFLDKTGQMQKQLQEAGITSKETVEEPAVEPVQAKPADPLPALDVAGLTKEIMKKIGAEFDFDGLNAFVAKSQETDEKVEMLEGLVKELTANRENELAEMIEPPASRFAWSVKNRPSAKDANKLSKDDPKDDNLEKSAPGVPAGYWLSEASLTVPVEE